MERLKRLRRETAEKPETRFVGEVSELRSGAGSKGSKDPHQRTDKSLGVLTDTRIIEPLSLEETRLVAAGWTAKERLGTDIWQSPENGFYYSEEMALRILEKGGTA